MSSILAVFSSLKSEYEEASKDLESVEENIKRITGREPSTGKKSLKRPVPGSDGGKNLEDGEITEEPAKRNKFIGSAFSRVYGSNRPRERIVESDKEDEPRKPVIQSQVIPAVREVKPRHQAIEEQLSDEKSMARNRRMFGMILGTLQKFQSEESRRKQTTQKRVEIEEKLEKMAEEERANIRKERKQLFQKRRERQAQIRRIELKMERVEIHQEWEKSHKTLANFIQTKTKPPLFYLPMKHTPESEKRWKETKDKYRLILAEKRAKVQKELNDIDELYKKEEEEAMEQEASKNNLDDNADETNDDLNEQIADETTNSNVEIGSGEIAASKEHNTDNDHNSNDINLEEGQSVKDKSSEHLGEKEFEPIYDDDE